jgi:serine/threonine protein kinase
LNELAFMLDEQAYERRSLFARVLVREYLDERYLRLSLAGVMPDIDASMERMPFHWEQHTIATPYPRLGRYGILDQEDLSAWKKVESRFRDMGFVLIRQLGIGQFGRVYEALNRYNPHIPRHVAVKIDRIVRGKKKEAIQSAEATMAIGEALATAPHVIRIFDAGKLKGKRFTYHVLQLVDGETLDHLVGVSGGEHSSMLPPRHGHRSVKEVQQDYLKTIKASTKEIWRRQRMARPFLDPLNLAQALEVFTSILLWLEEIHQLDYAVNDLKNGNLMVSRRGQLKGIDLDSYSPITNPMDRVTDFFFLAVSLTLFLLNVARPHQESMRGCTGLLQSPATLRDAIAGTWSFGDVALLSDGRVISDEVIDLLRDVIDRSRDHTYAHDSRCFTRDIDRLILLKRTIFATEIVLD